MTGQEKLKKPRRISSKFNSRAMIGAITLASFILILCSSDVAIEYMKKGLGLCAATVIPSLFPFMIISELIVSSGVGVRISRVLARPMRWLFGVSEAGAAAYFLGIVCGFPIGAKTAVSMYDRDVISKRELERLLTFCNNPGSAFVISAVGVSLLGSRGLGVVLYVCVILSSIIVGAVGKLFFSREQRNGSTVAPVAASGDAIKTVTDAIQSSAISMLSVCAYVVFFSALVGCIGSLLVHFSPPEELIASIFGFFELSSGVGAAVGTSSKMGTLLLCALFLGWSGLSVHFQIMSVCSGRNLSFKPYIIAKAAQGVVCAAFAAIAVKFMFPWLIEDNHDVFVPQNNTLFSFGTLMCLAFFAASLICVAVGWAQTVKIFKNKDEKIEKRY